MIVAKEESTELRLPKIKQKPTVREILGKTEEDKETVKKLHWLHLLDLEHADAVISDAFWYVICKICNPQPEFEQHQQFLLDRI